MAIVSTNISHKYLYQDDIKRYDFTFKLLDDNSLDVYCVRDNVEARLINDVDYSIEYDELVGGYITLTDTGCSKFINGDILGILVSPNLLQELKTDEHNVLYKKDIENSLDKLTQLYQVLSAKISKLPLPPLYLDDADISYGDITDIYNESKNYQETIAAIKTEIDEQTAMISGIASDLNNKFATDEEVIAGVVTDKIISPKGVVDVIANKFATDEEVIAGVVTDKIISPKGVVDVIANKFATDEEIDLATVINKIVAPKNVKDMISKFGDIRYYPENFVDNDDMTACSQSFISSYTNVYLGEIGNALLFNLHSEKYSAQLAIRANDDGTFYRITSANGNFDDRLWRKIRCATT